MSLIKKILIANRGEVTRRIIKSANALGIETLALYTETEKDNPYYNEATESVQLEGNSLLESYLNQELIIKIAKNYNCNAIHPGYGFLSENAEFAKKVMDNNLIFIGPSSNAIKLMGSKAKAKNLLNKIGIPCIEGFNSKDIINTDELIEKSSKIGYPLLIKASAGGGGKGMRIVNSHTELIESIEIAKNESKKSFGNSDLIIEKYIENPRHIEVQVLGDSHGNIIHLFERHCSLQRRYQKIIEEAPANFLSKTTKEVLYDYSIQIAKNINYSSLGTIEFLLDDQDNIYFIEMNTRLQVEHVVTEMITNNDLVKLQIEVANGKNLNELEVNNKILGHSIQARVYAENPDNNFLPASGEILYLELPESENKLRIEHALFENAEISNSFDPMLAKIVSFGKTRDESIKNLEKALCNTTIIGISTNINFLLNCINTNKFINDNYSTNFISESEIERDKLKDADFSFNEALLIAANKISEVFNSKPLNGFRLNLSSVYNFKFEHLKNIYNINIYQSNSSKKEFFINSKLTPFVNGNVKVFQIKDKVYVISKYKIFDFNIVNEIEILDDALAENKLTAPMNATVRKILIKNNEIVEEGQLLIILEAMKMELEIKSPFTGRVNMIICKTGSQVLEGQTLIEIEENE